MSNKTTKITKAQLIDSLDQKDLKLVLNSDIQKIVTSSVKTLLKRERKSIYEELLLEIEAISPSNVGFFKEVLKRVIGQRPLKVSVSDEGFISL